MFVNSSGTTTHVRTYLEQLSVFKSESLCGIPPFEIDKSFTSGDTSPSSSTGDVSLSETSLTSVPLSKSSIFSKTKEAKMADVVMETH